MNIFFLDRSPMMAAKYHCNKHVIKMILETAQLLSTAHRIVDGDRAKNLDKLYRVTHKNHPTTKWVCSSVTHYIWTYELFCELCREYRTRYGKVHLSEIKLIETLNSPPQFMAHAGWIDPPQVMPPHCKTSDTVKAYRSYYIREKGHICQWPNDLEPYWFTRYPEPMTA